jgi:hypothetical protein
VAVPGGTYPAFRRRLTCPLTGAGAQLGSAVLTGLYLVIKYLGKEWINWLMGWYFTCAALYTVPNVRTQAVHLVSIHSARLRHP